MHLSIITTCKGRLKFLKRSLPFMLDQWTDVDYDVIVVDYGCPDGAFAWCQQQNHPRLKCIYVGSDTEYFKVSRAMNIGAKFSDAENYLFVDSDLLLAEDVVSEVATALTETYLADLTVDPVCHGNGAFYLHTPSYAYNESLVSVARGIRAETFHDLRGYDESFEGWGFNDIDLKQRARSTGYSSSYLPGRVVFLNHGEEESTRFYKIKDRKISATKNQERMDLLDRAVNPQDYGIPGPGTRIYVNSYQWRNPNFTITQRNDHTGWGKFFEDYVTIHTDDIHGPGAIFDVVASFGALNRVSSVEKYVQALKHHTKHKLIVTVDNRSSGSWPEVYNRLFAPFELLQLFPNNNNQYYVSESGTGYDAREVNAVDFFNSKARSIGIVHSGV